MVAGVVIGLLGIAATLGLGCFVQWKTNKSFKAIFQMMAALPGGDAALRIYEDMQRTGQVRGLPYQTSTGEWKVRWGIPPYKENTPEP